MHGAKPSPTRPIEYGMHGPGGTGKTVAWLYTAHMIAEKYPRSRMLFARQYMKDCRTSVIPTFEDHVLPAEHPARAGPSRNSREAYFYPNGSEIRIGGLADDERWFSSEWNLVAINECNQVGLDGWQKFHRALRWPYGPPFRLLIGDCNPDSTYHWFYKRFVAPDEPSPYRIACKSLHKDNPWLWDRRTNDWSREGLVYMNGLREGTSGLTHDRLFKGIWCAAEGQIWDVWSPQVHVLRNREVVFDEDLQTWWLKDKSCELEPIELTWFVGGMDWGYENAGTFQVWGFDREHRMYLVEEHYRKGRNNNWWVDEVMAPANKKYGLYKIIADSARPDAIDVANGVMDPEEYGLVIGCVKGADSVGSGIMLVHALLDPRRQGGPRIFLLENSLAHEPDGLLRDSPHRLEQEIESYRWKPAAQSRIFERTGGAPPPEEPLKKDDHGCDTLRYVCRAVFGQDMSPAIKPPPEKLTWMTLLNQDPNIDSF